MRLAYCLSGAAPFLQKVVIGETVATVGVPIVPAITAGAGALKGTTTACNQLMGVNLDTGTFVTAQSTDGSNPERVVTVITNPDAVYKTRLSGGATDGTALAIFTVDTADTAGTTVDTGTSTATYLDGVVWGFTGANAGLKRKVTAVATNNFTVVVPFHDIAVGDTFLAASTGAWFASHINCVQLTTLLTEADATAAWTGDAEFSVVDMELRDASADGRNKSFIYMVSNDHIYTNQ